MATANGGHVFNSDLLANEHDRDKIRDLYAPLEDILYHKELIDTFGKYNVLADDAKKRSRTLGKLAIVLGGMAIALAAIEVAIGISDEGGPARTLVFGFLAALCGILSIVIGAFGVLFGDKKRKWLHNRFMGERIRQFHFQSLIVQFPEIAGILLAHGGKAARRKEKFLSDRARLFRRFLGEYECNPGKFTGVISAEGEKEVWAIKPEPEIAARRPGHNDLVDIEKLHLALKELERELEGESGTRRPGGAEKGKADHRAELELFFQAYLDLRINHQLGYTNYKLENDHKIFSESPVRQAEVLENISKAGIAWLFLIHAAVLVIAGTALAQIPFAIDGIGARTLVSYIFSAAIIAIAIVALLIRAFQQGLQPEREAERYQQYRSALLRVREQFEAAATAVEKLDSMRHVERVAFDEMRNFLISNERVSFVV